VRYCSNGSTINFQTNASHFPNYQTQAGSMEAYTWTVTPRASGTFSYVGGTTSTSRYPQIQFVGYDSFLVKVVYQNDCSPKTDSQWIVYNQPVTANAGTDITVCYSSLNVNLNGTSTGPRDSLAWSSSITGSGTFNNRNILSPTYTFSANDKLLLKDTMILNVYAQQPSTCSNARDTVIVTINPRNFGTDSSLKICSGTALNYVPFSSVVGSSFAWTS
ncbi:MAG: hypothetical protein ACOVOV_10145, partial [Dolichospermum sp.]